MSQESFLSPSNALVASHPADLDDGQDQWSDSLDNPPAHDTIQESVNRSSQEDIPLVSTPKFAAANPAKVNHHPMIDTTIVGPAPIVESPVDRPFHENSSSHSLPTVQVTEPHSPGVPQVQSAHVSSFSEASLDSNRSARSGRSSLGTPAPPPSRRPNRPRSTLEQRSPNRLSGFFSNLIHRRDAPPSSPLSSTPQDRASPTPEESANASRASSPVIPPRPSTPPPNLPPPTLQDLGLSLSVLTNNLSPSHFSTPPASGAFLAPHYLLLCHAQGLDVLPLSSPPALQPYALIRRVSFKSVVVMEHRGVLVAIAGRRDGVRVYALDEVKKAVEWRLDVEVRRERERARREEAKKTFTNPRDSAFDETPADSSPRPLVGKSKSIRKSPSSGTTFSSTSRSHTRKPKTPPHTAHQPSHSPPALAHIPNGRPPSYRDPSPARGQNTAVAVGARRSSITNVLSGSVSASRRNTDAGRDSNRGEDEKAELLDASDDEAINVMTAGASGSQALDERTSSMAASTGSASLALGSPRSNRPLSSTTLTPQPSRRNRPADLDLSTSRNGSAVRPAPPSPTPTLLTLRQALLASPPARNPAERHGADVEGDGDDDDDPEPSLNGTRTPTNERITFAQALQESRLPDLPPPGSRRTQQAILISQSHPIVTGEDSVPPSPTSVDGSSHHIRQSQDTQASNTLSSRRRRRRWSVLDGFFANGSTTPSSQPASPPLLPATQQMPPLPRVPRTPTVTRERQAQVTLTRSHSTTFRSASTPQPTASTRPSTAQGSTTTPSATSVDIPPIPPPPHSRFLSRLIGSAFASKRSEGHGDSDPQPDQDAARKSATALAPPAPAPKLEYVKLPGTKGALLIKAVETSKKSFLAILCGDNGEKVELFAGTYRTALGLSRTFILPDSPRSLELQLQGDDLVEVFLVFAQNVFGLEPATVRVREVRIGRAERRAARRRARELRGAEEGQGAEPDSAVPVDETSTVTVSVGVVSSTSGTGDSVVADTVTSASTPGRSTPADPAPAASVVNPAIAHSDEMLALAAAQMGPYSTFQQLQYSPKFPLAAIADEYIIPPTYPDFLQYRAEHEPDVNGGNNVDLAQVQFSPPGLPLPPIVPPTKWYYRDPKGVVHGPWKSGLMQAWYRDGLLPPDLPVRREEDTEYTLLRDLRQQSVDPTQPFGPSPAPRSFTVDTSTPIPTDAAKPLLDPLSLLSQSRIFGPPALFFSTRGGHSTVIVDGRGRSVLKGRFMWTRDDEDEDAPPLQAGRLGDVKRLEAFDVQDRSVLVAMRQGGFEAVDFKDALLKPADASRNVLPHFLTTPSQVNRRQPFTWKIGMPVSTSPSSATSLLPLKSHSRLLHTPVKKLSTGPGKSAGRTEFGAGDGDSEHTRDEVVFLGRRDDSIYICERNGGAFRILRLCPTASASH